MKIKVKHINSTFNIVLLFCLVFGFKLPILNSTYLAGVIAFSFLVINPERFRTFWTLIKSKYNFTLLLISILLAPIVISIAVLHGTYDFSLAKDLASQFPVLICSLLVFSVIFPAIESEEKMLKLMLIVFFIQSIIIVLAFLLPSFMELVQLFQYPNGIEKGIGNRNNNVFRAMSISGDLFFGLSACYGLVYILYTKYILDKSIVRVSDVLLGLILIVGNVFVARTGFIGLGFAFVLLIFYKSLHSRIGTIMKILLVSFFIVIISWFLIPSRFQVLITESVMPFAFEFLYSYMDSNTMETSSTNVLMEMYNIHIDFSTLLIGDGYFVTETGSYYMKTDSGYLRQILFGGVFYFLFMLYYQINMLSIARIKKYFHVYQKSNMKTFGIVVLVYLLTIHIKGLTVGFMRMILIILFYYFSYLNWNTKSVEHKE